MLQHTATHHNTLQHTAALVLILFLIKNFISSSEIDEY